MKVFKVTLSIIDHARVGAEGITGVIENAHYPNHCMSPTVVKIESRDIGEWHDDNLLNKRATADAEFERLFKDKN